MGVKIFVDSDVIVSSIISDSGAAFDLLKSHPEIDKFISNYSQQEIIRVADRLGLVKSVAETRFKSCTQVDLDTSIEKIKKDYGKFVSDAKDAHIIAGAVAAEADFLVSYNLRHFKLNLIKQEWDIIGLRPGSLLQFLRGKKD